MLTFKGLFNLLIKYMLTIAFMINQLFIGLVSQINIELPVVDIQALSRSLQVQSKISYEGPCYCTSTRPHTWHRPR